MKIVIVPICAALLALTPEPLVALEISQIDANFRVAKVGSLAVHYFDA